MVLAEKKRSNTFAEASNSEEDRLPPSFCKEIRNFKCRSREFHNWIASTEACHNPRSLNKELCREVLQILVENACRSSYNSASEFGQRTFELTSAHKKEICRIVDEIIKASNELLQGSKQVVFEVMYLTMYVYQSKKVSIVPLFKVYGKQLDSFIIITKNTSRYRSFNNFLDGNDLPHSLVCAAKEGTYKIDPEINKYPLVFYTINSSKCRYWIPLNQQLTQYVPPLISCLFDRWIGIFDLIIVALRHFKVEVERYVSNIDYNSLPSTSMKCRFFKKLEKFLNYQPVWMTVENYVSTIAHSFFSDRSAGAHRDPDQQLIYSLLLNANLWISPESQFYQLLTSTCEKFSIPPCISCPSLFSNVIEKSKDLGTAFFEKLVSFFQGINIQRRELRIFCKKLWDFFCSVGDFIIIICKLYPEVAAMKKIYYALQAASFLLAVINIYLNKNPENDCEGRMSQVRANEILTRMDNDFTLKQFLKAKEMRTEERNIVDVLNKDIVKFVLKESNSETEGRLFQLINFESLENTNQPDRIPIYLSLKTIAETIEMLLDYYKENARVYVLSDDTYEILTNERTLRIYTYKHDTENGELQLICQKKDVSE